MSEAAEDEYERGEALSLDDLMEEQRECPCGALIRGKDLCGACEEDEWRRDREFRAECRQIEEEPHG